MDKNTITGLVVIVALLFGFSIYSSKQSKKYQEQQQHIADSIAYVQQQTSGGITDITQRTETEEEAHQRAIAEASAADSVLTAQIGDSLSSARNKKEETFRIENDLVIVTFTNKGGKISGVELKDYKNQFKSGNIQLYAPNSAYFDLKFFIERNFTNIEVNTEDYFFTPELTTSEDQSNQYVSMKLHADSASYLEYLYTIPKDNYMIDYQVRFVNMEKLFRANEREILFTWESIAPRNERGFQNENNATTISYKLPNDKSIENLGFSTGSKNETVNSRIQWVAFKQQFFSSIFVAQDNFINGEIKYSTYESGNTNIKKFQASMAAEFDKNNPQYNFRFYYGPNKYNILKEYDISAERLIPLGGNIIGVVNRWVVIPVFDWLENTGMSYGLIILILTVIIKIIIFPLTYKSYLSTAKMRLLKPEVDEIAAKYPKQEDAMKRQQATMELYKRAGVSPMGGCLPMLIQFPILIAMFRFFPASIELRGQSFLWATDLSSYDSILQLPFDIPFYGNHVSLFTLLMAVSTHISARINYAQQPATNQPGMGGMKFMMLWMMPVMLMLWFNNYASGLSYYYLLSNIITIGQTIGMRYMVNDEKLHAKLKHNASKKRPAKKKSKWQQRYEDMVKEQQRIQQQGSGKKK